MFGKFGGSIKKVILCSTAILLLFFLISPIGIAQEATNGDDNTSEDQMPEPQPATDVAVPVDDGDHKPVDEEQTFGEKNEAGADNERLPLMPWWAAVVIVLAVIAAGYWMVHIGCEADKRLNSGEIRRAIAGVLVLGFVIITVLSMLYEIPNKEIVSSYTQLVGVVIGFYFGSRIASADGDEEAETVKELLNEIKKAESIGDINQLKSNLNELVNKYEDS